MKAQAIWFLSSQGKNYECVVYDLRWLDTESKVTFTLEMGDWNMFNLTFKNITWVGIPQGGIAFLFVNANPEVEYLEGGFVKATFAVPK